MPAAAFLGLAKGVNPAFILSSFNLLNTALGISISPLITNSEGSNFTSYFPGNALDGFTFKVTSSPLLPSPRVTALKSEPFL